MTAWVRRFANYFLSIVKPCDLNFSNFLSTDDIRAAKNYLLRCYQQRAFPAELGHLCVTPPKPLLASSKLLCVHLFLGQDGLLHAGGRLSKAPIPQSQQFPVILSAHDHLTYLLYKYEHVNLAPLSYLPIQVPPTTYTASPDDLQTVCHLQEGSS